MTSQALSRIESSATFPLGGRAISGREKDLKERIASWIPEELSPDDRAKLLSEMKSDCERVIAEAIAAVPPANPQPQADDTEDPSEEEPEEGEEKPDDKEGSAQLLDRLLYKGVLPRYAFPTDVATFHVFDEPRSTTFRPIMRFKNKFEHGLLDRHVGVALLEYLITGKLPDFDAARLKQSTALLCSDLRRQDKTGVTYQESVKVKGKKGEEIEVPILATRNGKNFAIALAGPLTPEYPADSALLGLAEKPIVVNELIVRNNLPAATREVQFRLGL